MLKLLLISALAVVVTGQSDKCEMKGNTVTSFNNTNTYYFWASCKVPWVRGTKCGGYRVTINPVMKLARQGVAGPMVYVIRMANLNIKRLDDEHALRGVINNRRTQKFLEGTLSSPFLKTEPSALLNGSQVFTVTSDTSTKTAILKELNGDFTITYQLYDRKYPHTSSVTFQCHSSNFTPTAAPRQLCGDGSVYDMDFKDVIRTTFSNPHVVQTVKDRYCRGSNQLFVYGCKFPEEVMEKCAIITFKQGLIKYLEDPVRTFYYCAAYYCSGETDPNACNGLTGNLRSVPSSVRIPPRFNITCPHES